MASRRRSTSLSTRLTKKLATDATEASVAPGGPEVFEAGQVGLHHLAVTLEAEDQRDVDVDACADEPADGRHALRRRRAP